MIRKNITSKLVNKIAYGEDRTHARPHVKRRNNTKGTENVTLHDIGNILLVNLRRQNLKSGG